MSCPAGFFHGPGSYVALTLKGFREDFAQDLPTDEIAVLYAIQGLDLVPRHPTFALSPTGTCVARSTCVEEDGFAGGPSVGCAGGPLP